MKRFIALLLVIVVCFATTGCSLPFGQKNNEVENIETVEPIVGDQSTEPVDEVIGEVDETQGINEVTLTTEQPETTEVIEEVSEPESTTSKKRSFKEQHPYLFAFRFDGVNAYIDTTVYNQPEISNPTVTERRYTDMTADGLPGTLRVNGTLNGFTLTSEVNSQMGVFVRDGSDTDKITVEYVSSGNIKNERKKLNDTGNYSYYNFNESTYNMSMENVDSVKQSVFEFALRDGQEGSIAYGLIVSLTNGEYLIIRNSNLSGTVTMDEMKNVYKGCLEWVTE